MAQELPELTVADAAAWRAWLEAHHGEPQGVWLALARKGHPGLFYDEALEEALCFGWIDGQVRRGDGERFYWQRFTPRRPRSAWSKRNVEIVGRLEAEGRMRRAGRAAVAQAQADGRWEAAYDGPARATVPEDLAAALAADPAAAAAFAALSSQNRYAIIYRLGTLRRAETRERRVAEYVAMLARGETIHPQRRVPSAPAGKVPTDNSTERGIMSEERKTGLEEDLEALDEVDAGAQEAGDASSQAKPERKTGLEQDLEALDEKD